jgi:hypothetical protein
MKRLGHEAKLAAATEHSSLDILLFQFQDIFNEEAWA